LKLVSLEFFLRNDEERGSMRTFLYTGVLYPETQNKLANLRGKELTTKELLEIFGYSPKTSMCDTFLYKEKLIEPRGTQTTPIRGGRQQLWRVR